MNPIIIPLLLISISCALSKTAYFNAESLRKDMVADDGSYQWSDDVWSETSNGDAQFSEWTPNADAIFVEGGGEGVSRIINLPEGVTDVNSLVSEGAPHVTIGVNATTVMSLTSGVIDIQGLHGEMTIAAKVIGKSGLIKNGPGLLAFGQAPAGYEGDTVVNEGTLRFVTNRYPENSKLIIENEAIFQVFGGENTVQGLSSASESTIIENGYKFLNSTLTIHVDSEDFSYAGKIRDNGMALSIVKTGGGLQRLSGGLAHTGTTRISEGTLLILGDASEAQSAVQIEKGATLGGTGTIGGPTTLDAGGFLAPGNQGIGPLVFMDVLDISAVDNSGNLIFELFQPGNSDSVTSASLRIGEGQLGFRDFVFTATDGLSPGTFVLFSSASSIEGTLDTNDLTGQFGAWKGVLSLKDNDVILTVSKN